MQNALKILENLDHRGAVGADPLMGDGAGISVAQESALTQSALHGWALGGEGFLWALQKKTPRRVAQLPAGRPKVLKVAEK